MSDLDVGKFGKKGVDLSNYGAGLKKEDLKSKEQKSIFDAIDSDGNGIIDETEMKNFKDELDSSEDNHVSGKEAKAFLKNNNLKGINKKEILKFLSEYALNTQDVKQVKVIEQNGKKSVQIIYNDGSEEVVNHDRSSVVISTDQNKMTTKRFLDENKNLVKQQTITQQGDTTETEYAPDGKTPIKTVSTSKETGSVTTVVYNENGEPVSKEVLAGATVHNYIMDEDGNEVLTSKVENKGLPAKERKTEYTYNEDGTVSVNISQAGKTTVQQLKDGKVLSSESVEGNVKTVSTYAQDGSRIEVSTDENGNEITTSYNAEGKRLSQTKTVGGRTYTVEYDGNGNTKVVLQNGESIEALAKHFGSTKQQVLEANGGKIRGWAGDDVVVPGELEADDKRLQNRQTAQEAKDAYAEVAEQIRREEEQAKARKKISLKAKHDTFEEVARASFENEGITPNKRQMKQRIEEIKKNNPDLKDGELKGKRITVPVAPEIYKNVVDAGNKRKQKEAEKLHAAQAKSEANQIVKDLKTAAKIGDKGTGIGLGTDMELLKKTISSIKDPKVLAEVERQIADIPGKVYGKRYEADNTHSALETFLASEVSDEEVNEFINTLLKNGAMTDKAATDAKARMTVRLITDGGDGMGTDCDKIKSGIKVIDSPEVLEAVNDLISKHSSGWGLWTKSSSLQDYLDGEMWDSEIKYLNGLMAEQGAVTGEEKTETAYDLLREAVEGAGTNIEYMKKALQTVKTPQERQDLEKKLDAYLKEKGIERQYPGQSSLQAIMYDECDGFGGIGVNHEEITKFNEMMIKQGAYTEQEAQAIRAEQAALQMSEGNWSNIEEAVKNIKDPAVLTKMETILKSKGLGSVEDVISKNLSDSDAMKVRGFMAINGLVPASDAAPIVLELIKSGDFDNIAIGLSAIRSSEVAESVDKNLKAQGSSLSEVLTKFNKDKDEYAAKSKLWNSLSKALVFVGAGPLASYISDEYKENTDMANHLYVEGKDTINLTDEQKNNYSDVVGIFDDSITNAKGQMQDVKDSEGAVSYIINSVRDQAGFLGTTRADISDRLKYDEESQRLYKLAAEGKLTRIDDSGNVVPVTFEEIFKERQGVDYDKAKIDEVKNQSQNMMALSVVSKTLDDTLYRLDRAERQGTAEALTTGVLSSLETIKQLSGRQDVSVAGYEVKNGKIYKDGKLATLSDLKGLNSLLKSQIQQSYADAVGVTIPEGASDSKIEELLKDGYEAKMESFKGLYKEAFGKDAPDEMINNYVTAQSYGKMAVNAVVVLGAVIAAPFTGGGTLAVAAAAGGASITLSGLEASTDADGWTDNEIADNASQALVDGALTALGFKVGQYADEVAKAGKIISKLKAMGYEVSSDMASSTLAELIQNNGQISKDGFINNMIFSIAGNAAGRIFSQGAGKTGGVTDSGNGGKTGGATDGGNVSQSERYKTGIPDNPELKRLTKGLYLSGSYKTKLLELDEVLEYVEDPKIKEYINNSLKQLDFLDYKKLEEFQSLADAVNTYNNKYSIFAADDYKGRSAIDRMAAYARQSGVDLGEFMDGRGSTTPFRGRSAAALRSDLAVESKLYAMRQYMKNFPNSDMANYLYNDYYLKHLSDMNVDSRIINRCKLFDNKYGVKLMLSSDYTNADKVFDYMDNEFAKWKVASGSQAKYPPVIDFSSAKSNWYDTTSAYGQSASAAYSEPSFNGSLAFSGMDLYSVKWSLRHEMTHTNDLARGNIPAKYNLDEIMPKKTEVINGKPTEVPDFEHCKFADEFRRAGIYEGHIPYAFNNTQEFIAVAAEGDMSKYSPEFKQMLVDFGMPRWQLDLDNVNIAGAVSPKEGGFINSVKRKVDGLFSNSTDALASPLAAQSANSISSAEISEALSKIDEYAKYGFDYTTPVSEITDLNNSIENLLTLVKSGEVADVETVLNSIEALHSKLVLKGQEYQLKSVDKYTVNTLRQDLGLNINCLDSRMSQSINRMGDDRASALTDIYNTIGARIAAGEVPSKELLNDVLTKRLSGTNLDKSDIEHQFFLKMRDSYTWNAIDFRKSVSDIYPDQATALVKKYTEGFGLKAPVAQASSRMGLNGTEGTFFTKAELDFINENFVNVSTDMKTSISEVLDGIGKKIQQGESPSYELLRAAVLETGAKNKVNVRQLEDNVSDCIKQFDEWKPIAKYLDTPKRILERKDPTKISLETKEFRQTKGISGEYKPEVKTEAHEYNGVTGKNLRSSEIQPLTRVMNPQRAQTVVNIIDNIEWELKHGAIPSKQMLQNAIKDELFKHPNPAIDPDKFLVEIRDYLKDDAIFPDWASITTFWYKSESASQSILDSYPEFVTDFLKKRAD